MEDHSNRASWINADTTVTALAEHHLTQWQEQLDYLIDTNASIAELAYCRNQIKQLQEDLSGLKAN